MSLIEKKVNFDQYLFRAHAIGNLMVGAHTGLTENQIKEHDSLWPRSQGIGKPLTPLQTVKLGQLVQKKIAKPELSQTTKSYLEQIFNEIYHGRKTHWTNKYTEKGLIVEQKSLTLYTEFLRLYRGLKSPLLKNKERLNNDFITGEPDFIKGFVGDIKSSWSLDTFPQFKSNLDNSIYEWQMISYLWLCDKTEGRVIYCLVDTPDHLILDEKYKMAKKMGVTELPAEVVEEIENKFTFQDLSIPERLREYDVAIDQTHIDLIKQQVKLSRDYLNLLVEKHEDSYVKPYSI